MKKDCNNEEKKEELYSHPNNDSDCCGNPSICDSFVSCSNSVSKTRIQFSISESIIRNKYDLYQLNQQYDKKDQFYDSSKHSLNGFGQFITNRIL